LPEGLSILYNGDGTATISGIPSDASAGGCGGEPGDPEGGDVCGGFAFALTATNAYGTYVQALGMDVNTLPTIDSPTRPPSTPALPVRSQYTGRGSRNRSSIRGMKVYSPQPACSSSTTRTAPPA